MQLMPSSVLAQPYNISGVYYLIGVMETASGIKLNPDSTFQFFFSQGALDRAGDGKWSIRNDEIVLHSDKANEGIKLVESWKAASDSSIVEFESENEMVLPYIHVSIKGKDRSDFRNLNENGKVGFDEVVGGAIYVFFELCPEKIHEIIPANKDDNHFKIAVLSEIFNVDFDNVKLKLIDGNLQGEHPLLTGSDFKYEKN